VAILSSVLQGDGYEVTFGTLLKAMSVPGLLPHAIEIDAVDGEPGADTQ